MAWAVHLDSEVTAASHHPARARAALARLAELLGGQPADEVGALCLLRAYDLACSQPLLRPLYEQLRRQAPALTRRLVD